MENTQTFRFVKMYDAMIRCGVHYDEFEINTKPYQHINFDYNEKESYGGTIREEIKQIFLKEIVDNIIVTGDRYALIIKNSDISIKIPNKLLPSTFILTINPKSNKAWRVGWVCEINFKLKKKNNYIKHLLAYAKRLNGVEKKKKFDLFKWFRKNNG